MQKLCGLRLVLFVLFAILGAFARADIEEAKKSLIGNEQKALLAASHLADWSAARAVPKEEALVLADVGAGYADVTIVGSNDVAPETFANVLNEWSGGIGEIRYFRGTPYSSARWSKSVRVGVRASASQSLDLGSLREDLKETSSNVVTLVNAPSYARVDPGRLSFTEVGFSSKLAVVPAGESLGQFAISAEVPSFAFALLVFLVLPPVMVAFVILRLFRKKQQDYGANSRELRQFAARMTLAALRWMFLASLPAAAILVLTRQCFALADVCFGGGSIDDSIALLAIPVLTSSLLSMSVLQKKMTLGNVERPPVGPPQVLLKANTLTGFGKPLVFLLAVAIFVSSLTSLRSLGDPMGYALGALLSAVMSSAAYALFTVLNRKEPTVTPEGVDSGLLELTRSLAVRMQTPLESLTISDQNLRNPTYAFGMLTVPRRAIDELTAEELRFGIAFALASRVSMRAQVLRVGLPIFVLYVLLTALSKQATDAFALSLLLTFVPLLLIILLIGPWIRFESRRANIKRIGRAMEVAGNSEAAASFLESAWLPQYSGSSDGGANARMVLKEFRRRYPTAVSSEGI